MVGVPHPDLGEVVKTFVVLKPGRVSPSDEVVAYLRPHLASFKVPRLSSLSTAVRRSASGNRCGACSATRAGPEG